jgi:hypothetical protein
LKTSIGGVYLDRELLLKRILIWWSVRLTNCFIKQKK